MKEKILVIPNDPFFEYLGKDHSFLEMYFNPFLKFECHVASFEDNYDYPEGLFKDIIIHPFREKHFKKTIFYPWRIVRVLARFLLRVAKLSRIIKEHKIQIVRGYGISHITLAGLLASKLTSKPYVVSLHNDYDYMFSFGGRLRALIKHIMEKIIISYADHIIAISPFLREYSLEHGARKVSVVHNPIGLNPFLRVGHGRTAPVSHERVLMFAGRFFDPQKNFLRLVKAYSLIDNNLRENSRLIVLGSGGDKLDYFKKKVVELGIEKNVCFQGKVKRTEMPEWFAKGYFFVLPSLYEALPNALIEAMASGLPVLTSNHPSCAYLASEKTGILVNPLDVADIKKGMEQMLLLGREEYMDKVKNSLNKAKEFNDNDVYDAIIVLYENLIKKRK